MWVRLLKDRDARHCSYVHKLVSVLTHQQGAAEWQKSNSSFNFSSSDSEELKSLLWYTNSDITENINTKYKNNKTHSHCISHLCAFILKAPADRQTVFLYKQGRGQQQGIMGAQVRCVTCVSTLTFSFDVMWESNHSCFWNSWMFVLRNDNSSDETTKKTLTVIIQSGSTFSPERPRSPPYPDDDRWRWWHHPSGRLSGSNRPLTGMHRHQWSNNLTERKHQLTHWDHKHSHCGVFYFHWPGYGLKYASMNRWWSP